MSFMYILNNRGPMIGPCDIPHFIDWVAEYASSKATYFNDNDKVYSQN